MIVARALRKLAGHREGDHHLAEGDAFELFSALLDGGLPELELGAVVGALAMKPLSETELLGLCRAARARVHRLRWNAASLPVVLPSYPTAHTGPNLAPLVAMALAGFGVPVLIHGPLDGQGGATTAAVLRELGLLPSVSLADAAAALEKSKVAFVPTGLLSPPLAQLLSLRARLGVCAVAQQIARLLDPFDSDALLLVPAEDPDQAGLLGAVLEADSDKALLFVGPDGESFTDPVRRPSIEHFDGGTRRLLFAAESTAAPSPRRARLPERDDAKGVAQWTRQALDGRVPMPPPVANLLASCLYAAGYTEDFNQSKAIVAVRAHSAAAPS